MPQKKVEGLVLKKYSGFYYVQDGERTLYQCRLRGKIKDLVATGDRVLISVLEPGSGVLEEVLPRKSELYRPRIANASLVLIVLAYNQPAPSTVLLDRLLVLVQYHGLRPCLVLNKCDLPPETNSLLIRDYYPRAGFLMIATSARDHSGVDCLRDVIRGEIAVFTGPSGAGKSTLLNELAGNQNIPTGEVSRKIGRGKHTTRHVELHVLPSGGWVADTPGFSVLDLPPLTSRDLGLCYPDFEAYRGHCRFADCLHLKETDCAVKKAVEDGAIASFRYQNYTHLLAEVMEKERCYR
ncbi:MAG TPA: ribosome small subunit-dependent GTPase A [Syntrophomonadaceae bacterium]|nr:ribosome small subunit-dependent GTPase A [Syntrophomonadaceae bacterium]